jgi:hypothetical protein
MRPRALLVNSIYILHGISIGRPFFFSTYNLLEKLLSP